MNSSKHIVEVRRAWLRILDHAGIDGVTIHDLRRTFGSYMVSNGVSLPIIAKALGHKDTSTTQIYARLNLDPVQEAVDSMNETILKLCDVPLFPDETPSLPDEAQSPILRSIH